MTDFSGYKICELLPKIQDVLSITVNSKPDTEVFKLTICIRDEFKI